MFRNLALGLLVFASFSPFTPAHAAPPLYGEVLVIEPGRFLTADDRQRLEASGVHVLRELGRDRYLVRRERALAATASHARTLLANALEAPVRKIGVDEAIDRGSGSAEIQVLFHDDVTLEDAIAAVVAAGGEPLESRDAAHSFRAVVNARLTRAAVEALEAGNLAHILRHRPTRIEAANAEAAALSNVPAVREDLGLTGAGVVASVYEISPLQADHVEFGDRATGPAGAAETHATHVAGTIGAAGLRPEAQGMAPEVTIVGHVVDLDFTESKRTSFTSERPSVDNNSWSFVLGWNYAPDRSRDWEWWGFTQEFGAYTADTEDLDRLALTVPTLMIYSSGNDNNDDGPTTSPFAHYHGDSDTVWCSSASGSGTDCPESTCGTRCETERHPADGPWNTMSLVAALKNGLAVGAVGMDTQLASFSSRGPAVDGRIKPEVVAKGLNQFSTTVNNGYGVLQGTSMAAPVVTGIGALLTEQWKKTFHGNPRPEFLRTIIIHGAQDLGNAGPDYEYGFGLIDAAVSADAIADTTDEIRRIATGAVGRDQRWQSSIDLEAGDEVRVTLGWADPANVAYTVPALVNDLDLVLIGPDGSEIRPWVLDPNQPEALAVRGVNEVDNVERIDAVVTESGRWTLEVAGAGVSTTSSQPFILVASHPLAAGRIACADPYEPNETAGAASRGLPDERLIRASLCGAADRDFFRFTPGETGVISATVTSEVALRLSLLAGSEVLGTVDAGAGESRDLDVATPAADVEITVRIEPLSDAEGEYTLRVDWPGEAPSRRRGVRR